MSHLILIEVASQTDLRKETAVYKIFATTYHRFTTYLINKVEMFLKLEKKFNFVFCFHVILIIGSFEQD